MKGLNVKQLNGFYGRAQILFDVALTVGPGEVVALMGRNGAGKTTTMKAIIGLLENRRGSITFDGTELIHMQPFAINRLGVGYVPEDRRIFTELTVLENLSIAQPNGVNVKIADAKIADAKIADAKRFTLERLFDLFPNLKEMPNRLGAQMSGGEQQMLSVARTLIGNPHLVLLDEPSEGIAPIVVQKMIDAVLAMKAAGIGVLLSEQNLRFAQQVADRAYVLEKGQVKFDGPFSQLMADEALRRQYLTI